MNQRPVKIGIGGPVGSGKTMCVLRLCQWLQEELSMAVVTNDIYTRVAIHFSARLLRECRVHRANLGAGISCGLRTRQILCFESGVGRVLPYRNGCLRRQSDRCGQRDASHDRRFGAGTPSARRRHRLTEPSQSHRRAFVVRHSHVLVPYLASDFAISISAAGT